MVSDRVRRYKVAVRPEASFTPSSSAEARTCSVLRALPTNPWLRGEELEPDVVGGLGRRLAGLGHHALQAQELHRRSPRRRLPGAGMSGNDREQALRVEGSGEGLVEPAVRRDRDDLGDRRGRDVDAGLALFVGPRSAPA